MLNIPLSPDKESKLRERAAAVGKDVTKYVLQVVEEDLAMSEPMAALNSPQSQEQWEKDLDAWVEGHPRLDTIADDSRDSIYAGRGE